MAFDMLIDGLLVAGSHRLEVIDPSTGEVFEHCARASAADLDHAVAAANAAFAGWKSLALAKR